jgi:threonine synthase
VSFEEALFSGYAPDGGLFVPETLPQISRTTLKEWSQLSYADLIYQILRLFISSDEVDDASLKSISERSLQGFLDPVHAVNIRHLHHHVYIAELWHGPTQCFKDFGLRGVVNLLSHFCQKKNHRLTLLVATTGDTGPAAVQAVADANNPNLSIVVHYPHGQISDFQRQSMTTVNSPQVKIIAFDGGGDDMDIPIKNILASSSLADATPSSPSSSIPPSYTGVNSYNIGRPLLQMVHYAWTYMRVVEQIDHGMLGETTVDIVVPTGAMGNLVSGVMVAEMGIPLGIFTSGVNINDITHRLISTGSFHRASVMHRTMSEAISTCRNPQWTKSGERCACVFDV